MDPSRVGIDNLRSFLADLLDSHIERELPKVQDEVRRLLHYVGQEIVDIGIERSKPSQIRIFLTRISIDFQCIIKNGLEGNYDSRDRAFFSTDDTNTYRRLRAAVHSENEGFGDYMKRDGQRRRIITNVFEESGEEWEEDGRKMMEPRSC